MTAANRAEFLRGVRDYLPLIPGVLPFALILGAVATASGLPVAMGHSMSYVIFAGSAQFVTAQLIGAGTPALVVVLTAAVVNLRHMLGSATLAPHLQHLSMRWRVVLAYLLTDEAFVLSVQRLQNPALRRVAHWHLLGAGGSLWLGWQITTLLGFFVGGVVPPSWQLEFTLPVTFIALLFPALRDKPTIAAMIVGGAVTVVCSSLPCNIGLLLAAMAGIAAGVTAQRATTVLEP